MKTLWDLFGLSRRKPASSSSSSSSGKRAYVPPAAHAAAMKKKKKEEGRNLFGLSVRQQDVVCFVAIAVVAIVWIYHKVDWELTVFPRSLGGVVQVVSEGGMPTELPEEVDASFPLHVLPPGRKPLWPLRSLGRPLANATLVLFHSELVESGSQVLPRALPQHNALLSVLHEVHRGVFQRVVWLRPEWSTNFEETTGDPVWVETGLASDGSLRVTHGEDYFVFRQLFEPEPEKLREHVPFSLQVLPVSDMYRRKTMIPVSSEVVVVVDSSYLARYDPLFADLRRLGLPSREANFLRTWQTGICLEAKDGFRKQRQFLSLQQILSQVFEKAVYSLPLDVFLKRVSGAFEMTCGRHPHRLWEGLHFVLNSLNTSQLRLLQKEGFPVSVGASALPPAKQISRALASVVTFLTRTGLPEPVLLSVSDSFGQRHGNLTHHLTAELMLALGHRAVLHRHPSPEDD
eukprot:RCo048139